YSVRAGGGGSGEGLSGTGDLRCRRQGRLGALLDAHLDAVERDSEAEARNRSIAARERSFADPARAETIEAGGPAKIGSSERPDRIDHRVRCRVWRHAMNVPTPPMPELLSRCGRCVAGLPPGRWIEPGREP